MESINFDALNVRSRKHGWVKDVVELVGWFVLPFIALGLLGAVIKSDAFLNFAAPLVPILAFVGVILFIIKSFKHRASFVTETSNTMRNFAAANNWTYHEQPAGWSNNGAQYIPEGYFTNSTYEARTLWAVEGVVQGNRFIFASLECIVKPNLIGRASVAFASVLTLPVGTPLTQDTVDKDIRILTTQMGTHITLHYSASTQSEVKKLFAVIANNA